MELSNLNIIEQEIFSMTQKKKAKSIGFLVCYQFLMGPGVNTWWKCQ